MQKKYKDQLPILLQDWMFLPLAFRSLKPYDEFITTYLCCFKCCRQLIFNSPERTDDSNNDNLPEEPANNPVSELPSASDKKIPQNKETVIAFVVIKNNKAYDYVTESF